jgi:Mn-dependent DtxR family transcriptional regulator
MSERHIRQRPGDGSQKVFNAICLLAQELGTPPPQQMVADFMGVSQQYISNMMYRLEVEHRIKWINRYYYRVDKATWQPPPDSEV